MSLQQAPATGPTGMAPPFEVSAPTDHDNKKKLRGLFGFGKKKGADAAGNANANANAVAKDAATTSLKPAPTLVPTSATSPKTLAKESKEPSKPTSPIQTDSFSGVSTSSYVLPSSPGRSVAALSSSPRISSPAGSQIFERDVQESSSVPMPNSPAIPSHITTENMIPPVLDASSEAITDGQLDPDTVEIITHTSHLTVAGGPGSPGTGSWVEDLASSFTEKSDKEKEKEREDAFDDVRRLSFISFADVVQAEQQQQQYQQASGSLAGLASLGSSPAPSKSGSVKGLELSPRKIQSQSQNKAVGSPTRSPQLAAATSITTSSSTLLSGSDILVETMSQALRRTASGDLGGVRSTPQSPV